VVAALSYRWRALLWIGLYLAAGGLVSLFLEDPGAIVLIWPPAGVAYAILLLEGRRHWPLIVVGVLLVHLLVAPVPLLFLLFSIAANTLSALAGVSFVRLFGPLDLSSLKVRTGFRLLGGGAVLSAVSAGIGVTGLLVAGMSSAGQALPALAKWLMGDLLGIAAITPTLLMAARAWNRGSLSDAPIPFGSRRERALWVVGLLLGMAAMLYLGARSPAYALGLSSLPLMLLLWSALRFEPLLTAAAGTLLVLSATTMAGLGHAGFSPPSSLLETAILLVFMTLIAVIPLVVAAATYESRMAAFNLVRRATIDRLTGLPNRTALEDWTERQLAQESALPVALLYLDLDQFKVINDTVSHAQGDRLLLRLAGLLNASLQPGEFLARLGGDEFGLLLCTCEREQALARAEQLRHLIGEFREPAGEHILSTSASIGLVLVNRPGQSYSDVLAAADAACFTAKELGGNRVQLAGTDDAALVERTRAMHWAMRLQRAMSEKRIELHCQSIVATRARSGSEAAESRVEILLRLQDGGDEFPASQVVAAAERFQLAARLDRYIIDRTLDWFEQHPAVADRMHTVSINLSAQSLAAGDLIDHLRARLPSGALRPSALCFEITETAAIADLQLAQRFISEMRALGCRFALDDFGSGFCSFAYLAKLDVDYFKIDGSFVREIEDSPLALSIVRAIGEIARSLGKLTVAECAETEAIRARLGLLGVDFVQGYAIDRPIPLAAYFSSPSADSRSATAEGQPPAYAGSARARLAGDA
jgi:diguanylate cyclase (GGDEF)-like protein